MNDAKDWFDDVVAASKEAAGLPADWGSPPTPLSADEELEDVPRPPRLRAGMTTAELLPYGEVVHTFDGLDLEVERLTSPALQAPGGGITVCDPAAPWLGRPLQLDLRGDVLRVELAVLRRSTPDGDVLQGAVAVVGDLSAVTTWLPMPDDRLSIYVGSGAFVARNDLDAVAERAEALALRTVTDGLVPVEIGDRVAALAFDAGNGPGAYEVLLGRGRGALPLALLVDLGVLPR